MGECQNRVAILEWAKVHYANEELTIHVPNILSDSVYIVSLTPSPYESGILDRVLLGKVNLLYRSLDYSDDASGRC